MVLTVVLLDNHENFIRFLNPELINLEETCEVGHLRLLSIEYWVEDFTAAKEEFKVGNKLWISGDKNLTDCLYVIDTALERDYFKENNIVFEAEEVLVELNYAPFFSQTDLVNAGRVDSNIGVVSVDRDLLGFLFGDYFNIGIVQEVLHQNLNKILPKGTMNLMDLLRFIEEETGNVFITRYLKDPQNNTIHRYLDFLNPNDSDKTWDLIIEFNYPSVEDDPSEAVLPDEEEIQNEEVENEEDIVVFPDENRPEITPTSELGLRILKNDEILMYKLNDELVPLDFDAESLGLTGDEEYEITFKSYVQNNTNYLDIIVIGESYDAEEDDVNSTETVNTFEVTLPNNIDIQLYDSNQVIFNYHINTLLGKIQEDILDLTYNAENIRYEINEEDTFNAVAPILNSDDLTYSQLTSLIEEWINLEVIKGQQVPMIVQRINDSSKTRESSSNVENNYWKRPIKPQDNVDSSAPANNTYEYWRGTAYWKAPFNKLSGEIFVADDSDTGIEYTEIFRRKDVDFDSDLESSTPKIGSVETSDEDPYAIYNDVCMKLKDKRDPELNIEVDVANYFKNKSNNYDLHDKVYVKVPTFDTLITAAVLKTVKNAHDVGTNKVELGNYNISTKAEQLETELLASDTTFKYPESKNFTITLQDETGNKLEGQYISVLLLKVENGSATPTGTVYSLKTDNQGQATITMNYNPGYYQFEINYGGDACYESSTSSVDVTVTGSIPIEISRLQPNSYQGVKYKYLKWNKYGGSPKAEHIINRSTVDLLRGQKSTGNLIMAIGKAITKADKKIWGNKLIRTIFVKKCARCGSTELYWGYLWGGKKDRGIFKPLNTVESGALTGRIICKKCGTSYDVTGKAGDRKLTVKQKTTVTDTATLRKLQTGTLIFGTQEYYVSIKSRPKNQGTVMPRTSTNKTYSGLVSSKVRKQAKYIVGSRNGVVAAKAIAIWISKYIQNEERDGFYQSPSRTLIRRKGNSACKTDLFLQMCDAVGVVNTGISCYYVFMQKNTASSRKKTKTKKSTKHMIARVNGVWVDCTLKNPWGHYRTGFGAIKNAQIVRYPSLPMNRKYT